MIKHMARMTLKKELPQRSKLKNPRFVLFILIYSIVNMMVIKYLLKRENTENKPGTVIEQNYL